MELLWRRNVTAGSVFILVIVIFLPSSVMSIDFLNLKENIINSSWKKIGIFYIQPTLMLQNAGYSTNIFSYDGVAEPDYKADMGMNFKISMFMGDRFIVQVDETPYYTWYAANKDQEYFNNGIKLSVHSWIGKFNCSYAYSFSNNKNQPNSEFGADVISGNYSSSLSVDYGRHDIFFLTMFYRTEKSRFKNGGYFKDFDLSGRMDRDKISVGVQANKVIFTRTVFYLRAENYKYMYNIETVKDGSGSKFSAGIKFPEIGPVEGDFAIGMNSFRPGSEESGNYSKLFGSGEISIRPVKTLKLRLGYILDNYYSFWTENAYYDERTWNTGIDYYLGKNLKAGYEYRKGKNTYYFISGDLAGRVDSSTTSTFNLGYRLSGRMGVGISYTRFALKTNAIDFNRSYDFIGGYITHEF